MARGFSIQVLILFVAACVSCVSSWDISNVHDRHRCQAHSKDPMEGCDRERTVYVDVVSSASKYKTVQSGMASPIRDIVQD